jgi:hypothetical protein
MEIGRSLDRGRAAGRDYESHVMSFMHYGNGSNGSENGGSGGRAERGIEMRAVHGRGRVNSVSREGQRMQAATAILQDDLMGLEENAHTHGAGDVLPAYEGKDDASDPDIKPLAGRMEMSPRG